MSLVTLFFGLIIGLAIGYWGQREVNRQLKDILGSIVDKRGKKAELSIPSLIRREILHLREEKQDLLEQVEIWSGLLSKAPIAYLQVDAENHLIWCNEQAKALLCIDRWQDGQVRLLLELVRSSDLDQLIERTRSTGETQVKKWVFYPAYYSSSSLNSYDHRVSIYGVSYLLPQDEVGVFLENQDSLTQAYSVWERSISDLTHELRTPLTSISLLAETLQKRLNSQEKRWSELIVKETNRLINLIETWLEISQLQENPSQQLNYEQVEIHSLISLAWDSLEPIAQSQEISLNYIGLDHVYIQADKSRLTQVFLNLFDNAIKHTAHNGIIQVEVKLLSTSQSLLINVIDSGDGFLPTDLPHVFERLYRGDPSRSRPSFDNPAKLRQGSGLGLSIVRQIIQAHQGTVMAKNAPSTGGAWLEIILPLTPNCIVSKNNL